MIRRSLMFLVLTLAAGSGSAQNQFFPLAPCRTDDTRASGPLISGQQRLFAIAGKCGVPLNAAAVSLNATVVGFSGNGYLTFYPAGGGLPGASTINFTSDQWSLANAVLVPLGTGGQIAIFAAAETHVIVDVNGYFASVSTSGGGLAAVAHDASLAGDGTTASPLALKVPVRVGGSASNSALALFEATSGAGVYGVHTPTDHRGFLGTDEAAVLGLSGQSNRVGVKGTGRSTAGIGVWGISATGAIGVLGDNNGSNSSGWAGYFDGRVRITGGVAKAGDTLIIDHPSDPDGQYLSHSGVASPREMNIYDGTLVLDSNGEGAVVLPSYFEDFNEDFRYQLTTIGQHADVYVAEEISGNRFVIAGGKPGLKVSWQVTGSRKDAFAIAFPTVVEKDKAENDRGRYLHPEAIALAREKAGKPPAEELLRIDSRKE